MAVNMHRSLISRAPIERFKFSRYESIDTDAMTPPITPTTPISPKEYDIMLATEEDKQDILKFLRKFFFQDEPLNKFLGIATPETPCEQLEKYASKDLGNGLNLKAVHNGKIIGVCLNSILNRGYVDKLNDNEVTDPKFSKISRMLNKVNRESKVFDRFPGCDKAMAVSIISVDGAYRGQGIAKELVNKTRDLAKERGCGFMTVDCSSHFTALAVKKLGFELHYTLKYSEHKENGEVVLKPEPPHEACTVYVQKI